MEILANNVHSLMLLWEYFTSQWSFFFHIIIYEFTNDSFFSTLAAVFIGLFPSVHNVAYQNYSDSWLY